MRTVKSWNEYFLDLADLVATRSKDLQTQVGCVIVDRNMRIVSTGYNGFPRGVEETPAKWEKPKKYRYVVHSEANAILDAKQDLRGCILYCTLQPCCECIKLIAGAGIDRVYFRNEYHGHAAESYQLAKEFGLTFEQLSFVGFEK